ncbi:MAG: InlB B-repeat-containing protein, partial [Erysipelothrix sp.]
MKKYYVIGISLLMILCLVPAYAQTEAPKESKIISETGVTQEESSRVLPEENKTETSDLSTEVEETSILEDALEEPKEITETVPLVETVKNTSSSQTVTDWFTTKEAQDVVMKTLGISETEPLSQAQIDSINRLEFYQIDLSNVRWDDFSPLSNLESLILNSSHNVPNLNGLDTFNKLNYLSISSTSVKTLDGIEKMSALKNVNMQNIEFDGSIDFFYGIGELDLDSLTLMSMPNVTDEYFAFMSKMKNLKTVSVESTQFSDMSVFAGMNSLTSINARNSYIKDISIAASLPKLMSLNLENFDADIVPTSKRNRVLDYSAFTTNFKPGLFSIAMDRQRAEVPLRFNNEKGYYYLDLSAIKVFKNSVIKKVNIEGVSSSEQYIYDKVTGFLTIPDAKVKSWQSKPNISYPVDTPSISFETTGPEGPGFIGRIFLFPDLNTLNHTVTYNYNNGEANTVVSNIINNSLLTRPSDPEYLNHRFLGWFSNPELTKSWNFDSSRVTQDMTLYAKWVQNPWTVNFKNGDNLIKTIHIENGELIPFEEILDIEVIGHNIEGYYKDENLTDEWDFFSNSILEDTTLWIKTSKQMFDVTFVDKDDVQIHVIEQIPYESKVPEGYQSKLEKIGSTYKIFTDKNMTIEWNSNTFKVLDDVKLYVSYYTNQYNLNFET